MSVDPFTLLPSASTHPTGGQGGQSGSYILSLHPYSTSSSSRLVLRHPSSRLTLVDAETLTTIDTLSSSAAHAEGALVSDVVTSTTASRDLDIPALEGKLPGDGGGHGESGAIWSAGKDAKIIRWDERTRGVASVTKASVRGPTPVISLAVHERQNLLVAGTELVGSESHLIYWDLRNPVQPLYTHSSTHSDDITSLHFLPTTPSWLNTAPKAEHPTPAHLLLSASTDGLVALTNPHETDEEEAFYGAEALDGSVAKCGVYVAGKTNKDKKLRVWARSDMDSMGTWSLGRGEESGDVELQTPVLFTTDRFRPLSLSKKPQRDRNSHIIVETPSTAEEEQNRKRDDRISTDYFIDVVPTLGVNHRSGQPIVFAGNNSGDIVAMHHRLDTKSSSSSDGKYEPSAFFLTPPSRSGILGHRDVVRCIYHDIKSSALYTGSEDGVLSGWHLPDFILTGDREHDDDGGNGREGVASDDDDDETSSSEDEDEGMDVDDDDDEHVMWNDNDGRYGGKRERSEVLGGGGKRTRRL